MIKRFIRWVRSFGKSKHREPEHLIMGGGEVPALLRGKPPNF